MPYIYFKANLSEGVLGSISVDGGFANNIRSTFSLILVDEGQHSIVYKSPNETVTAEFFDNVNAAEYVNIEIVFDEVGVITKAPSITKISDLEKLDEFDAVYEREQKYLAESYAKAKELIDPSNILAEAICGAYLEKLDPTVTDSYEELRDFTDRMLNSVNSALDTVEESKIKTSFLTFNMVNPGSRLGDISIDGGMSIPIYRNFVFKFDSGEHKIDYYLNSALAFSVTLKEGQHLRIDPHSNDVNSRYNVSELDEETERKFSEIYDSVQEALDGAYYETKEIIENNIAKDCSPSMVQVVKRQHLDYVDSLDRRTHDVQMEYLDYINNGGKASAPVYSPAGASTSKSGGSPIVVPSGSNQESNKGCGCLGWIIGIIIILFVLRTVLLELGINWL